MNSEQVRIVEECVALSASGRIHFGEVIARLMAAGVERYHADYSRSEVTFYAPDGGTCVVPMVHQSGAIAGPFSAQQVEAAVRQAQRGEVMFPEFTDLVLAAGCVGYFVQLSGKRVQYFGRNGEIHTEWFPGAKAT
jgi:uncharacterized protein YbcV (DUF1398 family)